MVRTSSITMLSMVEIVAVDEKCDVFYFVCFFVTLWNDEVYDNGNAMKQCKFQNNYGIMHRGRFVVVHLYSTLVWTPRIFYYGQIYTKNSDFGKFWGL